MFPEGGRFASQVDGTPPLAQCGLKQIIVETLNDPLRTPLGVPNGEVVDTLWGVLGCSMSPQRFFKSRHCARGGWFPPVHLCSPKIRVLPITYRYIHAWQD